MGQNIFEMKSVRRLVTALTSIENEAECAALMEDMMTAKEILDIAQRLDVAKLLSEKAVYSRIAEETGASTATISRVNRCYRYGAGGYQTALKHIAHSEEEADGKNKGSC